MSILAPVSTSLTATGCMLSVGELAGHDHVHALAHQRQPHFHQYLRRLARVDAERRRLCIDEPIPRASDQVAAGWDVREMDLAPDRIAGRLGNSDVALEVCAARRARWECATLRARRSRQPVRSPKRGPGARAPVKSSRDCRWMRAARRRRSPSRRQGGSRRLSHVTWPPMEIRD